MALLKSKGLKRWLTSLIAIATLAATYLPQLLPLLEGLKLGGAVVGGTALAHAAYSKTLFNYASGSLASLFAILTEIIAYVPGGEWLIILFTWLGGAFGVSAVTAKATK